MASGEISPCAQNIELFVDTPGSVGTGDTAVAVPGLTNVYAISAGRLRKLLLDVPDDDLLYLESDTGPIELPSPSRLVRFAAEKEKNTLWLANNRIETDTIGRQVAISGTNVHTTLMEFDILHMLARRADKIVTNDELSIQLWDSRGVHRPQRHTDSLRSQVTRLRRMFGEELGDPATGAIKTIRRTGYIAMSSVPSQSKTRPG